jgi:uncharacterized protein YecE (DUF72 family)
LRDEAETTKGGRVKLTPALEEALAQELCAAIAPLEEADRLGALLLQLTPGFAPGKHELGELTPLIELLAPRPVAIELRHRAWVKEDRLTDTLGWYEAHGAVWVGVDAPRGKSVTIMPPVDAVTRDDLAYIRAHGRNAEGYVKGRSVAERFGWHYDDDELREITGRAEELAEEVPNVRLQFNNNRGADAPEAATRARELLGQAALAR